MGQIVLDFFRDQSVLGRDRLAYAAQPGIDVLDVTFFIMPVRLSLCGVELLEWPGVRSRPSSEWCPLPLLHVAAIGLDLVRSLEGETQKATYSLPEVGTELRLARMGDRVRVYSTMNGREATVGYDELLSAFERFAQGVRRMLLESVPALRDDPHWGAWFTADDA